MILILLWVCEKDREEVFTTISLYPVKTIFHLVHSEVHRLKGPCTGRGKDWNLSSWVELSWGWNFNCFKAFTWIRNEVKRGENIKSNFSIAEITVTHDPCATLILPWSTHTHMICVSSHFMSNLYLGTFPERQVSTFCYICSQPYQWFIPSILD